MLDPFVKAPPDEFSADCEPKAPNDGLDNELEAGAPNTPEAVGVSVEGAPNGFDIEFGLPNGVAILSAGEAASKVAEDGFPKGFMTASGFEEAPKGFAFVLGLLKGFVRGSAVGAAPNVVAAGFPKGFTAASDF